MIKDVFINNKKSNHIISALDDNDNTSDDLNIGDENGNVIAEFTNGHIKTKNFDSEEATLTSIDNSFSDLNIGDENGNVIAEFENGHIRTKNFDSRNVHIINRLIDTNYQSLFLKNTNICPSKGYVCFSMDLRTTSTTLANASVYSNLLKTYGIPNSTFCILPMWCRADQNYLNKAIELMNDGNEICLHTDTAYDDTSSITEEEFKQVLISSINYFKNNIGTYPLSAVFMNGTLKESLIPVASHYFGWCQTKPNMWLDESLETLEEVQLNSETTNRYITKRIGLEHTGSYNQEELNSHIQKAKDLIDYAIENNKMIHFYSHSYEDPSSYSYTMYNVLLEPILQYIKQKIDRCELYAGSVAEMWNLILSKKS